MTYATQDNLIRRYGEALLIDLTDRDEPLTGAIVADVVDRALANTDATIDAFIGVKYALPVASVPPVLTDMAEAIAIYKLHPYSPEQKITDEYRQALRDLQAIASGLMVLPIEGKDAPGKSGNGARVTDRERPFTADNLKGFI